LALESVLGERLGGGLKMWINRVTKGNHGGKKEFSLRGKRERRAERRGIRQRRVWVRKTMEYSKLPVMTHKPALHA